MNHPTRLIAILDWDKLEFTGEGNHRGMVYNQKVATQRQGEKNGGKPKLNLECSLLIFRVLFYSI